MIKRISTLVIGLSIGATALFAASHAGPFDAAIQARQSHMRLNGFNIGVLGAMAQGKIAYDAEQATAAAANLSALANISQISYWPAGSDSFDNDKTRALPEIWENFADVQVKLAALVTATDAMSAVAGNSLQELQGAMGALGGACGACHKAYRKPK